jgi:DNA-binding CsgD family transcriptional regulator
MAFLKDKFGLTPAEAHLVLRLVQGDSLRVSAATLGIAYETARTVLKSVFQKTSTCRQAELVIVIIHAMKGLRTLARSSDPALSAQMMQVA